MHRVSRDLSEEERCLLNLLRPHLVQAYSESRLFSYLNEAAGISSDGFIVVDRAWRIRYVNARGLKQLKDYFGEQPGSALPARVSNWLQEKTRLKSAGELPVPDLTVGSNDRSLTVQTVATRDETEYPLFLHETVHQLDARPLQSLVLTTPKP